jgi:hypothetical protein
MLNPIILLAYLAGFVAFAVFYSREEGTRKAQITAVVGVILAFLLSLFLSLAIGGGILVAATFYVADRKNRSRAWAIPALILGPIILLIVVSLPKVAEEGTLSLTS